MSDYLGRGRGTAALVRDVVEHVLDETLDHDLAVDDSRLVSLGPRPTCTYAPAGRLPREGTRHLRRVIAVPPSGLPRVKHGAFSRSSSGNRGASRVISPAYSVGD